MRTSLSGICVTADTVAEEPRKIPPKTRATIREAIKPPSRRSRTRRSDDPLRHSEGTSWGQVTLNKPWQEALDTAA
jgi:hypothetical protein